MQSIIKNSRGFSLIEALIAIVVLTVAVLGLVAMQGTFATQTVDRTLQNSLIDAASSALTRCSNVGGAMNTQPTSYTYEGGLVVNVALTGSCNPDVNACSNVTATASAQGRSFALSTQVCNFR